MVSAWMIGNSNSAGGRRVPSSHRRSVSTGTPSSSPSAGRVSPSRFRSARNRRFHVVMRQYWRKRCVEEDRKLTAGPDGVRGTDIAFAYSMELHRPSLQRAAELLGRYVRELKDRL